MRRNERPTRAIRITGIITVALLGFLFWVIYGKTPAPAAANWIGHLPTVNASLNGLAASLLLMGFAAIKAGRKGLHMAMMIAATLASVTFLAGYILHHYYYGDTPFTASGLIRPLYFFILISHILLSMALVPLVLLTLYFALSGRFVSHKGIARWTFPVWMYVSVTGILVYLILNTFNGR